MRRYAEREEQLFFLGSCAGVDLLRTKRRRRRAWPAPGEDRTGRPVVPWSLDDLLRASAPLSPAQNAGVQGCTLQSSRTERNRTGPWSVAETAQRGTEGRARRPAAAGSDVGCPTPPPSTPRQGPVCPRVVGASGRLTSGACAPASPFLARLYESPSGEPPNMTTPCPRRRCVAGTTGRTSATSGG